METETIILDTPPGPRQVGKYEWPKVSQPQKRMIPTQRNATRGSE